MSGFKRAGTPAEDLLKWKPSRNNQSGTLGAPRPAYHPEQRSLAPGGTAWFGTLIGHSAFLF